MHQRRELNDKEFFNQKGDLKLILLGDSAVGKSK
jgi:GTPase SAR1 family protein